ncbi:hypothetical protein EV385_0516 [Krasilnikovia cinnamomea]|uniref:Uncharacterized protein n=1 Tax=Krasilnikovia cinnamomea TaxID=349313 RepID=A0A4Q7ZDM0_9ACTN|nr:hypothetical protein [Krasilnikovia cinnamomea]RZU48792.1 hypothetical protein EV385_0516 [Krasilnikovia cinnamomea]
MSILTFGVRLNDQSWSTALATLPSRFSESSHREGALRNERVQVDLSEVGYADFVTLGRLLVFVRSVTDAGADCSVRLPSIEGLRTGTPQDWNTAPRVMRRQTCRLYLEQTGMVEALGHHIDEEPRSDAVAANMDLESPGPASQAAPSHRYRRILRYRWMKVESVRNMLMKRPDETYRTLREMGLRSETAAAVNRGIVFELLENAEQHSDTAEILLGGVIVDPDTSGARAADFHTSMQTSARHAAAVNSPLIRLVVADTGRGVVRADAIVRAFDTCLGDADSGFDGAARGLWKVSRVVRAYRGALLVSNRMHVVGRVFEGGEAGEVLGTAPGGLTGTFVECAVLTSPGDSALIGAGQLATPRRRQSTARPKITSVTTQLSSPAGLLDEDRARIRDLRGSLPAGTTDLVVAVNTPHTGDRADDAGIGHAIAQIMDIAAEDITAQPVTIAFPNVNRPLMSVAVEYLNAGFDERAAEGAALPPPILVIAPSNGHYWVGGTPLQRRVLARLSTADPPAADTISSWPDDEAAAIAELANRTRLLLVGEESVALQARPEDAVTALAGWVGDEIARTIRDAPRGSGQGDVWRGRYLTPTLRVTNRWFDLDALLDRLTLQALTGVTLAALVEDAVGPLNGDATPPVIVRLEHTPAEMAAAFARSLTGHDESVDSLQDVPSAEHQSDASTRVLLVTDVVSSGTTLFRALTDAVDRELVPVGVAAVVDARTVEHRVSEPHHVEYGSGRIPLVSLATVDIDASADDQGGSEPIDPVLRRPEAGRRPTPRYLVEQDAYVHALQRNTAARLGHIERPADRHYTAYVDPTLLFREKEWSRRVFDKITGVISERHRDSFGADDAAACLLFPAGTADDLTTTADWLHAALTTAGLNLARPIAVPRAAHAGNWQLTGSVNLPPVKHAVILDSGSSSGHTVQQLVGLAADNDAVTITVVLLLNGMSDSDAVNLQRMATVRRSVRESTLGPAALEIYYVAKTAMRSITSGRCAICALRRRYGSVTLYAPIPHALAGHRAWLMRTLEARTKPVLFEEQAADLFGASVSQPDCVEYLSWRLQLRDAALDTTRRAKLFRRLPAVARNQPARDALVRLLVAESQWLTSAPLWFPECRSKIADMAASMLADNSALLIEPRLRAQAAILLAHVAPERFARELSGILRTNRREGLVIEQVLLETLLLIVDPRGSVQYPRNRVAQQLTEGLVYLEDQLRDKDKAPAIASDFVTLSLIRYMLSHARRPLRERPTDAQAAWFMLSHEMKSVSHDYGNSVWHIQRGIELAAAGGTVGSTERMRELWRTCERYLHEAILPNVEPLRQILLSKIVLADLAADDATRWEQSLSAGGDKVVDETTVRLEDILSEIDKGIRPSAEKADELLADLAWWPQFVLNPDGLLPRVIERGPIDVLQFIEEFFPPPAVIVAADPGDELDRRPTSIAFCTNRLITDIFDHIRINAEITHRIPGSPQKFRVELAQPRPDHIIVTVRNNGSARDTPGRGTGLETLRHRLARFGGALKEVPAGEGWTYAVAVQLDVWRMPA